MLHLIGGLLHIGLCLRVGPGIGTDQIGIQPRFPAESAPGPGHGGLVGGCGHQLVVAPGLLLAVKADALCHLRLVPVLPGLLYLRCFELSECLLLRTQRQVFQPYAYCPHLRLISK